MHYQEVRQRHYHSGKRFCCHWVEGHHCHCISTSRQVLQTYHPHPWRGTRKLVDGFRHRKCNHHIVRIHCHFRFPVWAGVSRKHCPHSRDGRIPPRNSLICPHYKNPKYCPWLLSRPKASAFPGSQPMKCSLQDHGTMCIWPCFQRSG